MVAKRALRNSLPLGHASVPLGNCPLCGRALVAGPSVDAHHVVPKSQGGKVTATLHRICHRKIHATLTEKQLAREFTTWPALQAQPALASFIQWVQKKQPEYYDNTLRPTRGR